MNTFSFWNWFTTYL